MKGQEACVPGCAQAQCGCPVLTPLHKPLSIHLGEEQAGYRRGAQLAWPFAVCPPWPG